MLNRLPLKEWGCLQKWNSIAPAVFVIQLGEEEKISKVNRTKDIVKKDGYNNGSPILLDVDHIGRTRVKSMLYLCA